MRSLIISLLIIPLGLVFGQSEEAQLVAEKCAVLLNTAPQEIALTRLGSGVSNHVYSVETASGKYAAKIFTKKTLGDVQELEHHVAGLQSLLFAVPKTVSLSLLQDKFPFHISEFVQGTPVSDLDLSSVAALMAKLHIDGSNLSPLPRERYKDANHYQRLFKKCESWVCCKDLKEIYDSLELSYLPSLPLGVIHGDFSFSNVLKTPNRQLTLIDFDHLCTSYLLTDLVRCHMFYGFDDEGNFLEDTVVRFAQAYDRIRKLEPCELQNFYTHMKLMMIDTTLEMYYHIHVLGDLPLEVVERAENKMLDPELLVKKIKNLSDMQSINLYPTEEQLSKPIIFFGLSGVGKTTIIKKMVEEHPDLFYIPVFTCTRKPRTDDNPQAFEYVSVEEFLKLDKEGAFILKMHEGGRYYGYRKSSLWCPWRHALLNCSPCGLGSAISIDAHLVLIDGDWEKGLIARNQPDQLAERGKVNERMVREYYSKDWFLKAMNIVVWNDWTKSSEVVEKLCLNIMNLKRLRREVVSEATILDAA